MSLITLFTVANCPYCKQVKVALEDCGLPFTEISLSSFPQKRKDLLRLTGSKVSVPQLFVQNEWIGSIDAALNYLRDFSASRWNAPEWRQETPLQRLEREVGASSSSSNQLNPRFMIPIMEEEEAEEATTNDCEISPDQNATPSESCLSDCAQECCRTSLRSATDPVRIQCPDGSSLTVLQMTEKLKEILHYGKRRYKFTSYKNCCTAEEIVSALAETYHISRSEAEEFGKLLHRHNMLHHVCENHTFEDTAAWFFRLQCFHTPSILNSYRIWPASVPPGNAIEVMNRLLGLFQRIEAAVIGLDGNVNYRIAFMCSLFPAFEDAVCELQAVDLSNVQGADMMAFALNVFNMMTKYAFMKLGVPVSESCRTSFLNTVQFKIAGHVFSLQDWLDGVLRGNRKSPVTKTHAFCKKDPRIAFASKVGDALASDCRLHFAVHCWSRSRRSPPIKTFTGPALEEELSFVAHAFCEEDDNVAFSGKERKMRLATIFRQYKSDFLFNTTSMPRAVLRFLYGSRRAKLERLINGKTLKMSSRKEDWTLGMSDFVAFDASQLKPNVRKVGKFVRKTTSPSSYRVDSSSRGGSQRSSVQSDNSTVSSGRSSTHSIGLGRLLPKRSRVGGRHQRENKKDSIPKPFLRRSLDGDERTVSLDEMDSNVSNTSACSSNVSDVVLLLDEPAVLRTNARTT